MINLKLQRLLDGYLDQLIDQDTYKLEKNKLTSSKKSLEENLLTLERTQTGWIEPMQKWIVQAENLPAIAECGTLLDKKRASKEIFGSDLRLSASEASGQHRDPWQFIVETKNSVKNAENFQQCAILERVRGIGPLSHPWEGRILPMYYTRKGKYLIVCEHTTAGSYATYQDKFTEVNSPAASIPGSREARYAYRCTIPASII